MRTISHLSAIILLAPALSGCGLLEDDTGDLAAARARWHKQGLDDYSIVQTRSCECLPPYKVQLIVRDGSIVEARDPETGEAYDVENLYGFMSIDDVFDHLAELRKNDPATFDVSFHGRYGFPDQIHVDLDAQMVDEELSMTISDFMPLSD